MTTGQQLTLVNQQALRRFLGSEGQTVTYREPQGSAHESGVVTGIDHRWVYVRYRGDKHSTPTCPLNLTLPRGDRDAR